MPARRPFVRIVTFTVVRNEQDIIEPFLRHNARLVDAMIVLDNRSADRTRKILNATARELGNVFVGDYPGLVFEQGQITTAAFRAAQETFFPDFFMPLDSDEFIGARSRQNLLKSLSATPSGSGCLIRWHTFMPGPDASEYSDPIPRLKWRRIRERPEYWKVVLRPAGKPFPPLRFRHGNHSLQDDAGEVQKLAKRARPPLLHLPIRSSAQIRAKGIVGWIANRNRRGRKPNESTHKQMLHDHFLENEQEWDTAELMRRAMEYAQKETVENWHDNATEADHGIDVQRRHSDGSFGDAATLIADARNPAAMRGHDIPLPPEEFQWLDAPPLRHAVETLHDDGPVAISGPGSAAIARYLGHCAGKVIATEYPPTPLPGQMLITLVPPGGEAAAVAAIRATGPETLLWFPLSPGRPPRVGPLIRAFARQGLHPDLVVTMGLRALAAPGGARKGLILFRKGSTASLQTTRILAAIGRTPSAYISTPAGPRLAPFQDDTVPHPASR